MDSNSYQKHLALKEQEWEARCVRCGACCGALDDPCENLFVDATCRWACRVYERRFGTWRTVSGKEFQCVPLREKLAKGESWPGDENCGYKR